MRKIGIKEIEDMSVGAAVLGTGGGGDPYIGKLMAIQAVRKYGEVTLLDPEEVPDDAVVVPTAMMGAPTVMIEKIPSGDEAFRTFDMLESSLGKKVYATMSIEAGGVNSMLPIMLAARRQIPLLDGDGMGRAFPELQMTTLHLYGVHTSPLVLADEKGNTLMIQTVTDKWSEDLARAATSVMGGSAFIAIYAIDGKTLKQACVPHTYTKCEEIGRTIREAKYNHKNPVDAVLEVTGGFELFRGKVIDVNRRTVGGFARGRADLDGLFEYKGQSCNIYFQNENIIARVGDDVLATAPDLIISLDTETALPVTTEGLKYGARIVLISVPCDERWRTEEGLATVGPRYFGYDIDYIPVEERVRLRKEMN